MILVLQFLLVWLSFAYTAGIGERAGVGASSKASGEGKGSATDKEGLCLALTSSICELPLEVQLLSFNTALYFANTFGYQFVKSIPKRNEKECALFASLFEMDTFSLHVASIVPTFRSHCDPRLLVPADKMCPSETIVDRKTDRVTTVWLRNTSNVWCRVPEYTYRGESERRCLPGHMSVSFMSTQRLTLKQLLGNKLIAHRKERCSAVVELSAENMLSHANFVTTRVQLQQMLKRDTIVRTAQKFYAKSKESMVIYSLPSTMSAQPIVSPSPPLLPVVSEPNNLLASSNILNSNSKGRIKVVLQLMVAQAENEGKFMHAPDILAGIGWPVLALKMVLFAFAPECFEVHIVVTNTASVLVGDSVYIHHTEMWDKNAKKRAEERGKYLKSVFDRPLPLAAQKQSVFGPSSKGGRAIPPKKQAVHSPKAREEITEDKVKLSETSVFERPLPFMKETPVFGTFKSENNQLQKKKKNSEKPSSEDSQQAEGSASSNHINAGLVSFLDGLLENAKRESSKPQALAANNHKLSLKNKHASQLSVHNEVLSNMNDMKRSQLVREKREKKRESSSSHESGIDELVENNGGKRVNRLKDRSQRGKGKSMKGNSRSQENDDMSEDDEEIEKARGARRSRRLLQQRSSSSNPKQTGGTEEEDKLKISLNPKVKAVVSAFPEIDFFIHGEGRGGALLNELDVLASLSTADIMIASAGGLSRFAAVFNMHGIVLCPESSGYPMHAHTLYGKNSMDGSSLQQVGSNGGNNGHPGGTSGESNVFFNMMPKFPRVLLVDASHLFNMGSGFFSNNRMISRRGSSDLNNSPDAAGSDYSVGKLKGLQAAIYGAKRSRLSVEGGLWLEEMVFKNAIELRTDPLLLAPPKAAASSSSSSIMGTVSVTLSRDQCLRVAAQNTPKGKLCDEKLWWKCGQSIV